jgi:acyl-CoA thioesterase I
LELFFQTGRADVSVRGGWAARIAVGGHRTLNRAGSPLSVVSYLALAVHAHADAPKNEGNAMKLKLGSSVTALYMATFALRATVTVAAAWAVLAGPTNHSVRADERVVKIVVLGDGFTSGVGLPAGRNFPDRLEFALKAKGQLATVVNAGVGQDSAANGLARLDRSVTDDTVAVILQLGANDMIRGKDPDVTRAALAAILQKLGSRHIPVLLCGARPHANLDDAQRKAFAGMFSGLASEYNALFYPAFDDAFVDDAQLKAADGFHPNPAGIEAVVTRILPQVEALIERARRADPLQ